MFTFKKTAINLWLYNKGDIREKMTNVNIELIKSNEEEILWDTLTNTNYKNATMRLDLITEEVFGSYGMAKILKFATPRKLLDLFATCEHQLFCYEISETFHSLLGNYTLEINWKLKQFVVELENMRNYLVFHPNEVEKGTNKMFKLDENNPEQWENLDSAYQVNHKKY